MYSDIHPVFHTHKYTYFYNQIWITTRLYTRIQKQSVNRNARYPEICHSLTKLLQVQQVINNVWKLRVIHSSLVIHRGDLRHVGKEEQKRLTVVQDPVCLEGLSPLTAHLMLERVETRTPRGRKGRQWLSGRFHRKDILSFLQFAVRCDIWICSCGRNKLCPRAFIFLNGGTER